jgi:hypothetical protein
MTPHSHGTSEATVRGGRCSMISWTLVTGAANSSAPSEKTTSCNELAAVTLRP